MSASPYSRALVEVYDHPLRYHVPSRRAAAGVAPYLVELDAYDWNGACQCEHFTCRLEHLLKQGLTAEVAFESGLADVPPWGTVEDSLRCFHVHVARLKWVDDFFALARTTNPRTPDEKES